MYAGFNFKDKDDENIDELYRTYLTNTLSYKELDMKEKEIKTYSKIKKKYKEKVFERFS